MFRSLLAVAALAIGCAAAPLDRQLAPVSSVQLPLPRYVIVEDAVRSYLAYEWDAHLTEWPMIERGRCLRWDVVAFGGETAYRVYAVTKPDTVRHAVQGGVDFTCRSAPNVAILHTHPPHSCEKADGPCVRGGYGAYECFPSDQDRAYLRWTRQAFALVQCDRNALVFYFPTAR